jgi:hypothetical protein
MGLVYISLLDLTIVDQVDTSVPNNRLSTPREASYVG